MFYLKSLKRRTVLTFLLLVVKLSKKKKQSIYQQLFKIKVKCQETSSLYGWYQASGRILITG